MSVGAILAAIERDAAREAEELVASGRSRADDLVEGAEAAARAEVEAAVVRAVREIEADGVRRVNAARMRRIEALAGSAADRIERAFAAATERTAAIASGGDEARWQAALAGLADEALALAGPRATLVVRAADAPAVAGVAERHGASMLVVGDDGAGPEGAPAGVAPPGVVARSADGRREVDATLPARLRRARVELIESVAMLLAGSDQPPAASGQPVAASSQPVAAAAHAGSGLR